jgi:hypothetical protein
VRTPVLRSISNCIKHERMGYNNDIHDLEASQSRPLPFAAAGSLSLHVEQARAGLCPIVKAA